MEFDRLMEATVLPKKTMFLGIFWGMSIGSKVLEMMIQNGGFLFGSCYIRPFSPFLFQP